MNQVQQLAQTAMGLPSRAKIAVLSVAVVTLFVLIMVVKATTQTTWVPVTGDIKQGRGGAIQTALSEKGIESKMSPNGDAVLVGKSQLSDARVALSEANVGTGSAHASYSSLLGKSAPKYGMTAKQELLFEKRLNEGLIATDIENATGYTASVRLTLPEANLFEDEKSTTKAGVTVDTNGSGLDKKQVKSITWLTSSAVKDLTPDNVTVVDDTGNTFTGNSSGVGNMMDEEQFKLQVEQRYNAKVENDLMTHIEKVVGPSKAIVASNATVNLDQIEKKITQYGGEDGDRNLVKAEKLTSESLADGASEPGGTAGTGSNIPDSTGSPTYQGDDTTITTDNGYLNTTTEREYNNDQLEEATRVAPGNVEKQRVSIILDKSVSTDTQNAIKDFVQSYMGGNAGDSFSISDAKLSAEADTSKSAAAAARRTQMYAYAKWAIVGFGMLLMAFFLRRALNARTVELMTPGEEMLLLEASVDPVPLKELEAAVNAASSFESQKRQELQRKVETVVDQKPDDVALLLRGWIQDSDRRGA